MFGFGFEWEPQTGGFEGVTLFADVSFGSNEYVAASAGFRIYFGGSQGSLTDRHRRDDPQENLSLQAIFDGGAPTQNQGQKQGQGQAG